MSVLDPHHLQVEQELHLVMWVRDQHRLDPHNPQHPQVWVQPRSQWLLLDYDHTQPHRREKECLLPFTSPQGRETDKLRRLENNLEPQPHLVMVVIAAIVAIVATVATVATAATAATAVTAVTVATVATAATTATTATAVTVATAATVATGVDTHLEDE